MKLLFDQNLSYKLVQRLLNDYPNSVHVRDAHLAEADDLAIWGYATAHRFVIVSKDSDFHQMSLLYGHPPKAVWLRVGNASTLAIEAILRERLATMLMFENDTDASFLALG